VRPLLFMGMISYSLYLIHGTITAVFYRVAYRLLAGTPTAEAFWMIPMIAFNIGCAFIFWWLFERTSMDWCRRIKLRSAAADSSATQHHSGLLATETATAQWIHWTSP
jgi:peptidoglycan/LPS O-acetylase OafA/YrhL